MDTVQDFEDILELFARHRVRYLIVGGLAFIYHAKPRYTKDIDLWIDADRENVIRANRALEDFGSPMLMTIDDPEEILQLGVAPNRIDFLCETIALDFAEVWPRRIESRYGRAPANWIDLESLLAIKSAIDHPRHQEDARVLRAVRDRRKSELLRRVGNDQPSTSPSRIGRKCPMRAPCKHPGFTRKKTPRTSESTVSAPGTGPHRCPLDTSRFTTSPRRSAPCR